MRKLASVQTIDALDPIPGADFVEVATVLGWRVVVKRGEFTVGDKCVYFEIDSLLPERPEFEFLRKSSYRQAIVECGSVLQRAGFRIKTVKMRGQVSQGLCMPLALLQDVGVPVGTDVTDTFDVIKWDPPEPACLRGITRGGFPDFLSKTDETRVQVLQDLLVRERGKRLYVTEKLDGSSHTVYVSSVDQGVAGRTRVYEDDSGAEICKIAKRHDLYTKMRALSTSTGKWYALQGELIGPGVQKNRYALCQTQFVVFSVLEIPSDAKLKAGASSIGKLVSHDEMLEVTKALGLDAVPQLGDIVLDHTVDELVGLARGTSALNSRVPREGIVLRSPERETDTRLSFKAINPDFLLKYDE